jgi:hypothetical protein
MRTNDNPSNQKTSGTTSSEGVTRTDEKTSTDGTTDSNHLQMSWLHFLLEQHAVVLDKLCGDISMSDKTPALSALILQQREETTHLVVPGARLKDSQVRPALVHLDSRDGS